jgi:hypothetical protein
MILSKVLYKTGLEMLLYKREGQDGEELLFALHRLRRGSVKREVVIGRFARGVIGRSRRRDLRDRMIGWS